MEKKRDGGQGRASLGRGEDGDDEEAEKVDVETDTSSSPSSCRRGYSLHCLHTHARCCSTSSGLVPAAVYEASFSPLFFDPFSPSRMQKIYLDKNRCSRVLNWVGV